VILVAGGTGRLGTELVGRLLADGQRVRVLTRDPARVAHLPGAEVAVADLRRETDLGPALRDVDAVVSAVHGFSAWGAGPAAVDRDGNARLIRAVQRVGVPFVLLSVLGASPTHPIELFRMKAAAEQQLRATELPWTIVRAGAFLELYQELLRRTAGRSGRPLVFGHGGNPITFAAVPQVAAAVQRALGDPACRGQVIDVAGPTMTFDELAADLGAGRPRHVSRLVLRLLSTARGAPIGRQAAAALVMDRYDMTRGAGSTPTRREALPDR